jgi:hypothetical protein
MFSEISLIFETSNKNYYSAFLEVLATEQRKCVQFEQCYKYGVTLSYYVICCDESRWKDSYLRCCNSCRTMSAISYEIPDAVVLLLGTYTNTIKY